MLRQVLSMSHMTLSRSERVALNKIVRMGGSCHNDEIAPEVAGKLDRLGLVGVDWAFVHHRRYRLTLRGQLEILQQRSPAEGLLGRLGRDIAGSLVGVIIGAIIDLLSGAPSKRV